MNAKCGPVKGDGDGCEVESEDSSHKDAVGRQVLETKRSPKLVPLDLRHRILSLKCFKFLPGDEAWSSRTQRRIESITGFEFFVVRKYDISGLAVELGFSAELLRDDAESDGASKSWVEVYRLGDIRPEG